MAAFALGLCACWNSDKQFGGMAGAVDWPSGVSEMQDRCFRCDFKLTLASFQFLRCSGSVPDSCQFGWPVTLVYHSNSERPGFSWACWAVPLAEPRWYGLAGKVGCPMLVPTACPLGDGFACLLGFHALLFPDSAVLSKIGAEKQKCRN